MLRESFIGRRPSRFQINPIVKAFIISETFLWSAWNFIAPIFAIFAVLQIPGGNVEIAATAYSVHLIVRIIFELISGKFMAKTSEYKKFLVTITGILLISFSYFSFSFNFTHTILLLYVFYGIMGMGLGIATPAKNSLFSTHLDKDKEAEEWGVHDAVVLTGVALSAALGGFIAKQYGFQPLFILAMIINLISIIPYILYINTRNHHKVSELNAT